MLIPTLFNPVQFYQENLEIRLRYSLWFNRRIFDPKHISNRIHDLHLPSKLRILNVFKTNMGLHNPNRFNGYFQTQTHICSKDC